jgi:hypothetical protein
MKDKEEVIRSAVPALPPLVFTQAPLLSVVGLQFITLLVWENPVLPVVLVVHPVGGYVTPSKASEKGMLVADATVTTT